MALYLEIFLGLLLSIVPITLGRPRHLNSRRLNLKLLKFENQIPLNFPGLVSEDLHLRMLHHHRDAVCNDGSSAG